MTTQSILLDQFIAASPAEVWRAIFDHMGPGWRDEILPRLAELVEPAAPVTHDLGAVDWTAVRLGARPGAARLIPGRSGELSASHVLLPSG